MPGALELDVRAMASGEDVGVGVQLVRAEQTDASAPS